MTRASVARVSGPHALQLRTDGVVSYVHEFGRPWAGRCPRLHRRRLRPSNLTRSDLGPKYRGLGAIRALTCSGGAACSSHSRRWSVPGSNRRPPACKAGALPTELTPRGANSSGIPGLLGLARGGRVYEIAGSRLHLARCAAPRRNCEATSCRRADLIRDGIRRSPQAGAQRSPSQPPPAPGRPR